jgi:flavin-dependent dehydrogenase
LSHADVAIVGGGPAGLATAIALGRAGLATVVFERTDYGAPRVGEHIPPGTKPVLAALGLADVLASDRHARCPGIRSAWGSDEPEDRHYLFHPHGDGLNLSRPDFDLSLAALAERSGAAVVTQARLTALARADGGWRLGVETPWAAVETQCKLVIDATGRTAAVGKRLGAKPVVYDELVGLCGRVTAAAPRNNIVLIEALAEGWWYSAGLADGSVIATFLTDPELIDTSKAKQPDTWLRYLDQAPMTAGRITGPGQVAELHVRTARTQRLDQPIGDGWLAVGDAAMSYDPLSSEGISKGLEWGKKAAAVAAALCRGDPAPSQAYQDEIGRTFAGYLVTRYRYYAAEKRWPDAPFWRRRRLPPKPIGAAESAGA